MKKRSVEFIVYDPPTPEYPYLTAIFMPETPVPLVVPWRTASEAEACGLEMAKNFIKRVDEEMGDGEHCTLEVTSLKK